MSTKNNTKGVSNHNTNMANPPAGSEVTGTPPSAVFPAPAATGTPPVAGSTLDSSASRLFAVEAKVKAFREGYSVLLAALYDGLQEFPNGDTTGRASVSGKRKDAAAKYAELLSEHPNIPSTVTPDAINAGLAVDAALAMVKRDLQQTLPRVASCGRQAAKGSCSEAAAVRSAARILARNDTVLAAKIATIDGALRHGKLVTTTANTAEQAAKAQQRAAVKAAKAAAKAAKAARSAMRVAQAHADAHPLTPDVVIVPAGTPGTTPKG